MVLNVLGICFGLVLLIWGANRFIGGAAAIANHLGMPPLLIGMVVVGFGTSAPELTVSLLAAYQGNPGLAIGNAYGSNIVNIGLILGITACITPILVESKVLRKELPILMAVTAVALFQVYDGQITRLDATFLLLVFSLLFGWSIWQGLRQRQDALAEEVSDELVSQKMSLAASIVWLIIGLAVLIVSSRLLVYNAVAIAQTLGVSDLIIGLTIVAIGTSLPELAAAIVAVRKNEHDLVLGNVLGSNLFNTLAVVGIAGVVHPVQIPIDLLQRDMLVMSLFTISLFFMGYGFRRQGRINRIEGAVLVIAFIGYLSWLISH